MFGFKKYQNVNVEMESEVSHLYPMGLNLVTILIVAKGTSHLQAQGLTLSSLIIALHINRKFPLSSPTCSLFICNINL